MADFCLVVLVFPDDLPLAVAHDASFTVFLSLSIYIFFSKFFIFSNMVVDIIFVDIVFYLI